MTTEPPENPQLNIVEDIKEIPKLESDTPKPISGEVQPPPPTAMQKHEASKAIIRQGLRTLNVPVVYGVGWMTDNRVTQEAAFTDAEIEVLAEVWAPLVSVDNPMAIAIVTTMGIVGNKALSVMTLNRERKQTHEVEAPVAETESVVSAPENAVESEGENNDSISAGIHSENGGSESVETPIGQNGADSE